MTDNEIIKGINYCANVEYRKNCDNCPIKAVCDSEDYGAIKLVNDLISRLQADKEALIAGQETLQKALAEKSAEIERLSDRNHKCLYLSDDETTEYCVDGPCPNYKTEAKIRTEVIKEFAKRLKSDMSYSYLFGREFCTDITIDNLVKEMVGDAE